MKKGFTAIETLITLGIIALTAGMSIPMYQNYQIRSDLDLAVAQTLHHLSSAQLKSQTGENDGQWGVYVPAGTVFLGESYVIRDTDFDESIALPTGISVFGIEEVIYSRVNGIPSPTGDIILEAANGDSRTITINADGTMSASGIEELTDEGDTGDDGSTDGGDTGSTDGGNTGGDTGSTDGGNTGGDTGGDDDDEGGSGDSGGSGGGGDDDDDGVITCEDRFSVAADGTIQTTGTVTATIEALGAEITYGSGGPEIQVTADISTDGGDTWNDLFNNAEIDGGEQQTISGLGSDQQILIKVQGRYGWLFNKTYTSNDESGHIEVLRNGDDPPAYDAYADQESLETFLQQILDDDGKISIGDYDAIILTELGSLGTSSADFQDAVFLLRFDQPEGSCAGTSDPRFKIEFERLENTGNGDANSKSYVGQSAWGYGDGQWIPLLSPDNQVATDAGLVEDVQGLAVQRQNGFVRVLLHGSHNNGSKEIVDARVTFDNAKITTVQNVEGNNKTEDPFNGIVNDGAGGDEVVIASDSGSLLFQTRVTVQDDTIDIYWTEVTGGGSDDDDDGSSSTGGDAGGGGDDEDDGDGDNDDGVSNNDDDDDIGTDDDTVDPCAAAYTLNNGRITLTEDADISFEILGSHVTYGSDGPEIQMHFSASVDGGSSWEPLFEFRDVDGGEEDVLTDVSAGSTIVLKAEGRRGWLFKKVTTAGDGSGRIKMLRRGNADPDTTIYRTPAKLKTFMKRVIQNRKVTINTKQILSLVEIQDIDGSEDYQDAAVLITIEKPASQGICGAQSDEDDDGGIGGTTGGDDDDENSGSTGGSEGGSGGEGGGSDDGNDEGDGTIEICHFPPGNPRNHQTITVSESAWSAHAAHGDRMGACEGDGDGDGILNSEDLCPNTYVPEPVPTEYMLFRRYALTRDSFVFHHGPRKKISDYTLSDTSGCSCEQLIDVAEGVRSYRFDQFPRLKRQMRSLFPFYTDGARKYGCGKALIQMIQKNTPM